MRIAIFTNNYLPNPYGVTGSIESFRREFLKRGHMVYIFAPRFKNYTDENPKVFRYPALNFNSNGINYPLGIPISWRMGRILKKLDIDIIHSQHPNLLGIAARRWARKKKIPLVFTWHTLYDHYAYFAKFIPQNFAANYMIKHAVKYANRSDAVIVPTDSIIPIIRRWGVQNKNVFPVATGVNEEELKNADGNAIREKYGVKPDEILLIAITRLTREKNVEFLFRAAAKILKNNKKVKFLIGADGNLMADLKKYISGEGLDEQVIFAGFIPNDIKKNYFAAGDIFIFSSKSETQGMVTSEAMYMGLPIVAVSATGTSSLVLNNGNGFLVKEDEKEFADAVEKLINDRELRNRFSEASRKIASSQFTSSVCAQKMLKIYEDAIKNYNIPPRP